MKLSHLLSEGTVFKNAGDFKSGTGIGDVINNSTLTTDFNNARSVVDQLERHGYTKSHQDSTSIVLSQGVNIVGLSWDDAQTKLTIVVD